MKIYDFLKYAVYALLFCAPAPILACAQPYGYLKVIPDAQWDRRPRNIFLQQDYGITDTRNVRAIYADTNAVVRLIYTYQQNPSDAYDVFGTDGDSKAARLTINPKILPAPFSTPYTINIFIETLDSESMKFNARFLVGKFRIDNPEMREITTNITLLSRLSAIVVVFSYPEKVGTLAHGVAVATKPILVAASHCGGVTTITESEYMKMSDKTKQKTGESNVIHK